MTKDRIILIGKGLQMRMERILITGIKELLAKHVLITRRAQQG